MLRDEEISDADLEFARDLAAVTQGGKIDWSAKDDGTFVAVRPRVTALLRRQKAGVGAARTIELVLSRRGATEASQVLRQRIDEAAPHPAQLAMNSLLSYLWQLVSDEHSNSLYGDFFEE